MSQKLGSWMILLGSVVALIGLCVLPAAFSNNAEKSLLSVGLSIFSMGILTVAGGIYAKAQDQLSETQAKAKDADARKVRGGCDRCQIELPAVQCKVHQMHLCDTCLEAHYDFRSCVYVPSTRRIIGKPSKATAAKAR